MKMKIAVSNCGHDLETIDEGLLASYAEVLQLGPHEEAIDAHLHCEAAVKECVAIVAIVDRLMLDGGKDAKFAAIDVLEMVRRMLKLGSNEC